MPDIKFCGMTRPGDVEAAIALGARYVGVILASGPRAVSLEKARALVADVPRRVGRVGVFGRERALDAVAEIARACELDVIQLHGDPTPDDVERARVSFGGQVWGAARVRGDQVPDAVAELFRVADAVVLDAYSPAALGGTGIALPWDSIADRIAGVRQRARLVLAGGLRAETVAGAIRSVRPDVVDVSSGVESAPGVKDHAKLRAFRDAVRAEGRPA